MVAWSLVVAVKVVRHGQLLNLFRRRRPTGVADELDMGSYKGRKNGGEDANIFT